ncbi:MAG: NAD-dependent protein deacylase [Erysipelotrichaceae bacterium]|nr:NAD-dependent protein deacylase [Erysipelotrichaceae bacterium]
MEKIEQLRQYIDEADRIVFFTGAGISTESGIPDFRSAQGIYTNNKRAEEMISHSFFLSNTEEFYDFYRKTMVFPEAQPNAAHKKIAELEETKKVSVVTQNIDGLHQKAGSTDVIEVHGSILRNTCMRCGKQYPLSAVTEAKGVPHCSCGGIIKPDVVLYEEALNEEDIEMAVEAIRDADLLIVCGTSLAVWPAAGFLRYFRGQHLVIINRDPTPKDAAADLVIHDSLAKVLGSL